MADALFHALSDELYAATSSPDFAYRLQAFAASGEPLVRAADADADSEVTAGLWVTVEEGATQADTAWWLTTDGPIAVGTTALAFSPFPLTSGGGEGGPSYDEVGPPAAGQTWTVQHGLGSEALVVQVWDMSTGEEVDVRKVITNANTVTVSAGVPLAQDGYRVVIFARPV